MHSIGLLSAEKNQKMAKHARGNGGGKDDTELMQHADTPMRHIVIVKPEEKEERYANPMVGPIPTCTIRIHRIWTRG